MFALFTMMIYTALDSLKNSMSSIRIVFALALLSVAFTANGQTDSVLVTKNFKFQDGVYQAFSDLQRNRPTWGWDSLLVVSATNPQTFLTQVDYIRHKDGTPMHLDSIWGIVISGIPYVRLPKDATPKALTAFAGLRLRGIICYYTYEDIEQRTVEVKAYNPVTGVPFRKATLKKQQTVEHQYMLHFLTGETVEFNRENVVAWISNDERLTEAVAALPEEELEEKLFKGLLIYVDRYPVYTLKH